jgi:hypothetical protein
MARRTAGNGKQVADTPVGPARKRAASVVPVRPRAAEISGRPPRPAPTREQIAQRAYELFLARGGEHGRHEDDWLRAEQELRSTDPALQPPGDGTNGG